jgi:hypothetical protein
MIHYFLNNEVPLPLLNILSREIYFSCKTPEWLI